MKMHHTMLDGRSINVELTAGGGGKGETRLARIKERKERVGGQRERRKEREMESLGEGGVVEQEEATESVAKAPASGASTQPGAVRMEIQGAKDAKARMRGGRRVKVKPSNGVSLGAVRKKVCSQLSGSCQAIARWEWSTEVQGAPVSKERQQGSEWKEKVWPDRSECHLGRVNHACRNVFLLTRPSLRPELSPACIAQRDWRTSPARPCSCDLFEDPIIQR